MTEICGCSKDKNRKPIVISIEGAKDGTTGKPKDIEIVVCPHSKDEQPCACGGIPIPGFQKLQAVPEGQGQPTDTSPNNDSRSGLYVTPSGGHQPASPSPPRPSIEKGRAPGSVNKGLGRSSGASQNTLDLDFDQDYTRLPIVSPRYHGPACVLEVNVMEKHEDSCPYKKLPNDKRHPIDDKVGPYEVVGRMVFKTCNPADESDYFTSSEYDSAVEAPPHTQIEVAEIIPLLQLQKSISDKNLTNIKISLPHSKEAKNMNDLKNILTKSDAIQKLASSSKQFLHTANVSIQTPILASKEICTDEDPFDIQNNTNDEGDDDEEDDGHYLKENEASVTDMKLVENDEIDISEVAKITANLLSREHRNVNELQAKKTKEKADDSQRKKMQKNLPTMKRNDVDSSGKNVSTMTALHIGMLDDNVRKRPR